MCRAPSRWPRECRSRHCPQAHGCTMPKGRQRRVSGGGWQAVSALAMLWRLVSAVGCARQLRGHLPAGPAAVSTTPEDVHSFAARPACLASPAGWLPAHPHLHAPPPAATRAALQQASLPSRVPQCWRCCTTALVAWACMAIPTAWTAHTAAHAASSCWRRCWNGLAERWAEAPPCSMCASSSSASACILS